jgi:hypothetical protein
MRTEGRRWLSDAAATAQQAAPGVVVSTELATGFAAEQLIGRSASAELVVLGSRGLGGFTGLLVGSIAVAVATHGHCPLVVVRGDAFETANSNEAEHDAGTDALAGKPVVVGVDGSTANTLSRRVQRQEHCPGTPYRLSYATLSSSRCCEVSPRGRPTTLIARDFTEFRTARRRARARAGPHADLARRLSEMVTKYPGEMWLAGESPAMGDVGDGADGRVLAQLPVCHLQTSPHDVPRRTDFFRLEDPAQVSH